MASVHRKVELQEQDDLRYLINNARRAANDKIDENLPPIQGDDPLRRCVEELVHDYITKTFTAATSNILINGHEPTPDTVTAILSSPLSSLSNDSPSIQKIEYEPISSKLMNQATILAKQQADLELEIAELRRKAPIAAVHNWGRALAEGMDESMDDEEQIVRDFRIRPGRTGLSADALRLERQDMVEESFRDGVRGLAGLKEMGGTAAKMERAKKAGEYVLLNR